MSKYIAHFFYAYSGRTVPFPDAVTGFYLYGQSLSDGVSPAPGPQSAITLVQPFANLMLDVPETGLIPLVEGAPFSDSERQISEMCNQARQSRGAGVFLGLKAGVPGAAMSALVRATPNYDRLMDMTIAARDLLSAMGLQLVMRGGLFVHGTSDQNLGTPNYGDLQTTLHQDIEQDMNALLGTNIPIPMFVSQLSAFAQTSGGTNIALQQLRACRSNPLSTPMIDSRMYFEANQDRLHGINTDYRDQGRACGERMFDTIFNGNPWRAFAPASITGLNAATDVDVLYDVPSPPILFDNSVIVQRANEGYEFDFSNDDGGPESILSELAAIQSVAVQGPQTVRIGMNRPIGAGWSGLYVPRVRYAYSGAAGNQLGRANPNGPAGNLVDSSPFTNHALHSDDMVGAGLDPRPQNVATRSFRIRSTGRVQIPNAPELSISSISLWSFIFRINDPSLSNRIIFERAFTNAAGYGLRWSSAGGGRLLFNLSTTANSISVPAASYADGEFHHGAILYDGGQPVANDRVIILVDGTRTVGTYVGAFPAALAPIDAPINIGSTNINASPDANILHFAQWLTLPQMYTIADFWDSGLVRSPIEPAGPEIDLPELFVRPDSNDQVGTVGGIVNHGTLGGVLDATTINMLPADITSDIPS